MIRRVFYYSGFRMKVFEWQGRELLGSYEFNPDSEGIHQFTEYLTKATVVPAQLLVDLVEEDFHRETIPHVTASDRKAITTRLLDRHYRGELHVHVELIGRDKFGRKDDTLLLSALVNKDILEPWLMHMQEHNVPLAGIWSLPLISEKMLAAVTKNEKNVMLISQQISTAQRESYFSAGKLMLSRQAKLDRNRRDRRDRRDRRNDFEGENRRESHDRRDDHAAPVSPVGSLVTPRNLPDIQPAAEEQGEYSELERRQQDDRRTQEDRRSHPVTDDATNAVLNIQKGAEQIHIFLTNQRVMSFVDRLFVYCLLPNDLVDDTRSVIKDTSVIHYKCVNIDELFKFYKLENCIDQEADTLFSFLCSSLPFSPDHYAQASEKKTYRRFQLEKVITLTSTLGSFILLLTASLLWLYSTELRQELYRVNTQREILERRYQKDYVPIQQRLTDAATVQATVDLARRLGAEAQQSPENVFEPLSVVFSDPLFQDIQLNKFTWKKYLPADLAALVKMQNASVSEPLPEGAVVEEVAAEEPSPNATGPALVPALELSGFLHRGERSYRETVELMNAFADALRQMPGVTNVVIQKMPVDMRPALSFTDEKGIDDLNSGDSKNSDLKKTANYYEILMGMAAEVGKHE
jgi:hypothetical protein